MGNSAKHIPKGSMCLSCKSKNSDYQCDKFFPVIDLNVWQRYDANTVGVKCIEFKKEL